MTTARERVQRNVDLGRSAVLAAAPDWTMKGDDAHTGLVDTLANLRHWAKRSGVSFYAALACADGHYHAELRAAESERREAERSERQAA